MATWSFAGSCFDGQTFEIDGTNVWELPWVRVEGVQAEVRDPLYSHAFLFEVFEIRPGPGIIRFAAGEFSNSVWGFYVQS